MKVLNPGIIQMSMKGFDSSLLSIKNQKIEKIKEFSKDNYEIYLEDKNLHEYYIVNYDNIEKKIFTPYLVVDKAKYIGNLGCEYDGKKALFKIWAPFAQYVQIVIYDYEKQILKKDMKKSDNVWIIELEDEKLGFCLDSKFYQFIVKNPNHQEKIVLDPYAKSMHVFNMPRDENVYDKVGKGAIVNLQKTTKVKDFAKIEDFDENKDAIVYEASIRDFTSFKGLSLKNRFSTFEAFCEKIDYIKSLGVTHIQLLPVMAFYFGIEDDYKNREDDFVQNSNYNWGYDPQNYFSLDGAYSKDPKNPYSRIDEFKNLINKIHELGMGVVLDVVYTHMIKTDFLSDIVPSYYFFQDDQGFMIGAFGNNLAMTNHMAKKLMLDSLKYFLQEFKVDGFRFDMMGDCPRDAMKEAYEVAKSINPKILFLGEGWRTFSAYNYSVKGADQDWLEEVDFIAMFSDDFRNLIKSGFGSEGDKRFITDGNVNTQDLFLSLSGYPKNIPNNKSINGIAQYIEAHDNLTLHDVIALALNLNPDKTQDELEIQKRIRLGLTLLATSKGLIFIHSGLEYGRTKQWKGCNLPKEKFSTNEQNITFINDSYASSDAINKFDWSFFENKEKVKTFEYLKFLVSLRRSDKSFRSDGNIKLLSDGQNDKFIAYKIENYIVIINADTKKRRFYIENSCNYKVLNGYEENVNFEKDNIFIEPLTPVILKKL